MKNSTVMKTKSAGLNRRLSTGNNSGAKTTVLTRSLEEMPMTDPLMVAGYLLTLATVTVIAFVS